MTKSEYQNIRKELLFTVPRGLVLRHMVVDLGLIGLAIAVELFSSAWLRVPVHAFLFSTIFFRAFGLMHESVHSVASRSPRYNLWVGRVSGWLCFLPFEAWKEIHLQHHYWAGNYQKDPTMKIVEKLRAGEVPMAGLLNFAWQSGLPLMAVNQHLVFWMKSWALSTKPGQRLRLAIGISLWLGLVLLAIASGRVLDLVAAFFVYLVMVETVNFPHHLDLPQLSGEKRLSLYDQHLISRTCIYPRWMARHLLLNFNYHVEHHLFPTLPYGQLPKVRELIEEKLSDHSSFHVCQGNSWIRSNRKKNFKQVFIGPELEVEPATKVSIAA